MRFDFLRPVPGAPGLSTVESPFDVDIRLFAHEDVPLERESFDQLFELLDLVRALDDIRAAESSGRIPPFFGEARAGIDRVVLTPDFHKGSLVPVGTVLRARHFCIPQAIGNDVCCGMRLLVTDLPVELLEPHWPEIQRRLRAIFFAGERDIPMSPRQREAMLRDGLSGLVDAAEDNRGRGLWSRFDRERARDDLDRTHANGRFATRGLFGFEGFIRSSGAIDGRDPQIGCVGGGNHFVELQRIDALFDGHAARAWGLSRGCLAIMVHSGSVGLGHAVGGWFMGRAREIFPTRVKAPKVGFHPLPTAGPRAQEGQRYLDGMGNAANFAFANRLFLGLMAIRAIEEATGHHLDARLVYDAPHNLVFPDGEVMLHRKGATPAHGPRETEWLGQPVIIPGSMGAASFLLRGEGSESALSSACHGAGRAMSRGRATHVARDEFERAMERLRVVGPIDPRAPDIARRPDIVEKYRRRVMEEAPHAYKSIDPVIDSVESTGVASKVARLWPLCTVKG